MQVDKQHLRQAIRTAGERVGGLTYVAERIGEPQLLVLAGTCACEHQSETVATRLACALYRGFPDLAPPVLDGADGLHTRGTPAPAAAAGSSHDAKHIDGGTTARARGSRPDVGDTVKPAALRAD